MAVASARASVPVPPAYPGHCPGSEAVGDVMTLPWQPAAASAARAHAQRVLREWGLGPRLCEDVALCLPELVTSAVLASAVSRPVVAPVHIGLAVSAAGCCLPGRVIEASPLVRQGPRL